uniref:Uncharacterized protein n=1 Tax=Panagrolaimus sp. ES5 TaxID=591445 RepID=A0AC34FHP6_9BILA
MWWSAFIVIVLIIIKVAAQDASKEEQITLISEKLRIAFEENKRFCKSYGNKDVNSKADNYDEGEERNIHRLYKHIVCNDNEKPYLKSYVEAIVFKIDINKGSNSNAEEKEKLLKPHYHKCGVDHAGHIVSNKWGGSGFAFNLFPQDGDLNSQMWNRICKNVTDFIVEEETFERKVITKYSFIYEDDGHPLRPTGYYYSFVYYENNKFIKAHFGFIMNESHQTAEKKEYFGQNNNVLIYIDKVGGSYWERRTCRIDLERINNIYGPTTSDGRLRNLLTAQIVTKNPHIYE